MTKVGAMFRGCLTGIIGLVLVVVVGSYISSYLYDAPFRYRTVKCAPCPNREKHAHHFTKNSMQDSRGTYAGVSVSPNKRLSRGNENEVFVVSPSNALIALDLVWVDNVTLEVRYKIAPSIKAYIHYGRAPSNFLQRLIFTEIPSDTNIGGNS